MSEFSDYTQLLPTGRSPIRSAGKPLHTIYTPFGGHTVTDVASKLRDAVMLDTSAGQLTMLTAGAKAFDVPVWPDARPIVEGYNVFEDPQVRGYESFLDELVGSTSPQETSLRLFMINENIDLRTSLDDWGLLRFGAGIIDPINLVPLPFAVGKGFFSGMKRTMLPGGLTIAGTEAIRHNIDPTSTMTETLMSVGTGTLLMGLIGGGVGRIPKGSMTVSEAFDKLVPTAPPGTAASLPFGFFGSLDGVGKRIARIFRSSANQGDSLDKFIDPERLNFVVEPSKDGKDVINWSFKGDDGIDLPIMMSRLEDGKLFVDSIVVPDNLRRQGIAMGIYKKAIQYAQDNHLKFVSDTETSKAAAGVWKALEDEGFNIKENKNVRFDDDGTRFSEDGKPNFEVRPLIEKRARGVPKRVQEELDDLKSQVRHDKKWLAIYKQEIAALKEKVKNAPVAGGAKTKAKNKLKEMEGRAKLTEGNLRQMQAALGEKESAIVKLLDSETVEDWDLLHTGYNTILSNIDQFPWWNLMKNKWRQYDPEIGKALQEYALDIASTPGLNTHAHKLGHAREPSVEALAKVHHGKWVEAKHKSNALYSKYMELGETTTAYKTFWLDTRQRMRGWHARNIAGEETPRTTSEGKMTLEEFETQITYAIQKGGKHPEPLVAEAAQGYIKALEDMGQEAARLHMFAGQKSIGRKIQQNQNLLDKLRARQEELPKRKDGSTAVDKQIEDLELEQIELYNMEEAWLETGGKDGQASNYIHRMWLHDKVVAKEVELKAALTKHFTDNPKEGVYTFRIGDKLHRVPANDPERIRAAVDEAYASILHEAELGGDAMFAMKTIDKRTWLTKRLAEFENDKTKYGQFRAQIIYGKLERIENGEPMGAGVGPLISRKLDIEDDVLLDLGVIESNVVAWMSHYFNRMGPQIEMARKFGDPQARHHIRRIIDDMYVVAKAAPESQQKKMLKEIDRMETAMNDLRDITLGVYQIPDNPSSITNRTLRLLRNFNILTAMGRSVMMAIGDIGNVVVSQGFRRTFSHGLESLSSGLRDGNIQMMRREVDLAGDVLEVILGTRYHQIAEIGPLTGAMNRFERGVATSAQRFFLLNLLGPWTDMARRFSGGMLQSQLIDYSIKWGKGELDEGGKMILSRLGVNEARAKQFAQEWQSSGSTKHKSMFIANTEQWVSEEAKRVFRGAINMELGRMVPTPGVVDKPKGLLKSEWWKVIGQYRGFSIGATHRIMGAAMQQPGKQKYAGIASMVGIAFTIDALKRPDYIDLTLEEQVLRAVELSAVTGIILDLNDTFERASAGGFGLRPLLGMDIRERSPNWANRLGSVGAVPNQWLTLMHGLFAEDAEVKDTARAIRYMIPYNNLLYWNEIFNRGQRSAVDTIESFGE